jgi:SM-20-related protein
VSSKQWFHSATPVDNPSFDLHIVKNFFDEKTCRELIAEMRASAASAALTYGKGDATVDERVRRVRRLSPSPQTVAFVTHQLDEQREEIGERFGIRLSGCEEPQFLCYRAGDFFVAHQDGNTGVVNLESDRARRISVSIFLNDQSSAPEADTYCGGSLVFSDWRNGARHEVTGVAGMWVAFRSELTHEVTPVTHGERFVIVSWYVV